MSEQERMRAALLEIIEKVNSVDPLNGIRHVWQEMARSVKETAQKGLGQELP